MVLDLLSSLIKLIISFTIIIIFSYYISQNIDLEQFIKNFYTIDFIFIFYASLCLIPAVIIKSLRLAVILQKLQSYGHVIYIQYIGILINSFIPFRVGELFMVFELSKKLLKNKVYIASSLIMDRLFEFIMIGVIFIYFTLHYNLKVNNETIIFYLMSFILILLCFFIFTIKYHNQILNNNIVQKLVLDNQKIISFIRKLLSDIYALFNIKTGFIVLLLTILSTSLFILSLYFVSKAFITEPIFLSIILSYCILIIGIAITSSPGGIGVMHAAITYGLILFNVEESLALLVAISFHLLNLAHNVFFGIISIMSSDIKINLRSYKIKKF